MLVSRTGICFPGEVFELFAQRALVVLDGEDVVTAAAGDVVGGAALTVQCVGGDDCSGDVDGFEKFCQQRDFVGLGADGELGDHGAGVLAQPGQQMHQMARRVAGAAPRLAVEGDHPPPADRAGAQPHPRADQLIQPVGGQALQAAADRRLRRHRSADTEPGQYLRRSVGGPLGDRDERLRSGQRGAQRHREHRGQAMPHAPRLTRIGYPLQRLQQARRGGRNVGQLADQWVGVVDNGQGGR